MGLAWVMPFLCTEHIPWGEAANLLNWFINYLANVSWLFFISSFSGFISADKRTVLWLEYVKISYAFRVSLHFHATTCLFSSIHLHFLTCLALSFPCVVPLRCAVSTVCHPLNTKKKSKLDKNELAFMRHIFPEMKCTMLLFTYF